MSDIGKEQDDFYIPFPAGGDEVSDIYDNYLQLRNQLKPSTANAILGSRALESYKSTLALTHLLCRNGRNEGLALFRDSGNVNAVLLQSWLSHVRTLAEMAVLSNSVSSFESIDERFLRNIAELSINVGVVLELPQILAKGGIILIYERSLPRTKVDGVAFRLPTGHAVIGISFRYPRLDHFWFTLLHELAHVCLHYDLLDEPILDDLKSSGESETDSLIEKQANRLAKDSIVDRAVWRNCEPRYEKSTKSIIEFGRQISMHPAIVAGLLQRELGKFDYFRPIVDQLDLRKMVFSNE